MGGWGNYGHTISCHVNICHKMILMAKSVNR